MRKIILATNNPHKIAEIKRIFKLYEFLTLKDIGFNEEIVEDGLTFEENALIKAEAVHNFMKNKTTLDCAVLADDSGICIKAINYEPGVYSARYSGKGDEGNRQKVLEKLIGIQDRTAYMQCYAVLIMPNGEKIIEEGKVYGLITKSKIGDDSFGYDPIFWSNKLNKTFGQATDEEKDSVSHRAMAMNKIKDYLDSINYRGADDSEY